MLIRRRVINVIILGLYANVHDYYLDPRVLLQDVLAKRIRRLVSIWFSLGAVGGLIAAILDASIIEQFVVFAAVSFVLVLATRPLVKKLTKNTEVKTNADRLIGKVGEVTREINTFSKGEVIVDFREWTAIALNNQSFAIGDKVVVVKIDGNKLVVDAIQEINIK